MYKLYNNCNCAFILPPQFGLPACTWPFCLSALTFLLLTTETNKIFKLPLAKVNYPEKNLSFYWRMKRQEEEEKHKVIDAENLFNEKAQLRSELELMEEGKVQNEAPEYKNEVSCITDESKEKRQNSDWKLATRIEMTAAHDVDGMRGGGREGGSLWGVSCVCGVCVCTKLM